MDTNIRKRRAHCQPEAPADPGALHDWTYPSLAGQESLSFLPADHRYILEPTPPPYAFSSGFLDANSPGYHSYIREQTGLIHNQPLGPPLGLDNLQSPSYLSAQQHITKKPRLNQPVHMPSAYADDLGAQDGGQEKSALGAHPDDDVTAGRKQSRFFSHGTLTNGWTGARLADCFASFSVCSTFEPQPHSYQPLLTPPSYDYDDPRPPALDTAIVSGQPQAHVSLLATPVTPDTAATLFPCDDPALMAQYVANYPPLEPARVMGLQPAIPREQMVYPSLSTATQFNRDADASHAASGLGLQRQMYLVDGPPRPGALPGAYAAGGAPAPYGGHDILMHLPSDFHPTHILDVRPATEQGSVQDEGAVADFFPAQKSTPAKRGPFKDQDSREKTAQTRKMGSCIRCRMQRIRCNLDPENENGPCLSCKKIASGTRVYRLNCLRLKITEVKLFKPGQVKGQEWTNRWRDSVMDDIGNWESSELRTIHVTEGYTGKSVRLQVRQFKPQPGDSLERKWVSRTGAKRTVKIPAFAIVNLDDAKSAFDQYIKQGLVGCCESLLGPRDRLLWRTYSVAMAVARDPATSLSERSLLMATLDLWVSVRLTTKSFEIVGDETLDMPRDIINDQDNPLHGKIPLPPVMGAQIDSVIIHQIQPRLRRKALEELQKMTQEKKQKTWLSTYLVSFILLHNIALVTKHDADYAKKHGLNRRFAREANVKEYNLGANTLLAYFHYCNKATYPFSADCKDQDLQTLAELDDEAIAFVHYTREIVAAHKKEWEGLWLRDEYEDEFYYVSQLYEHNWQPRTMA